VLASAAVPIAAEEFAARLIFDREIRKFVDVDHRMKPNTKDRNEDGIRSTTQPDAVAAEDVNVIVLGDSFVHGNRLTADQALPQRLERMARQAFRDRRVNVFNFGWTSSSPLLSYRLLRDVGAKYRPDAIILLVDATDFYDDLAHRLYLERRGIYAMVDHLPGTFYLLRSAARRWLTDRTSERILGLPSNRFFAYDAPLEETRHLFKSMTDSINEIAEFGRTVLGARFYLVFSARHFQYSDRESPLDRENSNYTPLGPRVTEPNRFFDEQFGTASFPYLSLLPAFQATTVFPTTFEDDPHWTDAGTQVAAEAIFAFCLRHGCFDPQPAEAR
jgi:hypothetical protein